MLKFPAMRMTQTLAHSHESCTNPKCQASLGSFRTCVAIALSPESLSPARLICLACALAEARRREIVLETENAAT